VKIYSVYLTRFGQGVFAGDFAVIESDLGTYRYELEYEDNGTWKNASDYLNNAREDFEYEFRDGVTDTELFEEVRQ
jgi:uncharacterized protein YjbK